MFVFSLRQFRFAVCNGFVDLGGDHRFKKCPALLEESVRVGVGFDKQLVGRLVVGVRNVVVEAERPEVLTDIASAHQILKSLQEKIGEHPEIGAAITKLEMALNDLAIQTGGLL